MRELFSAVVVSDVLVLSYHAVSERWPAALSVTPDRFESQLRTLVERGYAGATFGDAIAARPARSKTVAVTFDDGYRSVLSLARPILRELGLPATVFVPTDFVGSGRPMSWPGIDRWLGGEHEPELVPLSWEELGELRAAGWEIGSHTCTHPHLTRLADDALAEELGRSRERCEEMLGAPCRSLAYPYGDHDDRVVEAARAAGYDRACIVPKRLTPPSRLLWPRVGIYHDDGDAAFRLKVSRTVRRLRASPVWEPLDAARRRFF
jgi:peptidoglycan/xylan/chitin deacetylase (PgdA/CDA1 family)